MGFVSETGDVHMKPFPKPYCEPPGSGPKQQKDGVANPNKQGPRLLANVSVQAALAESMKDRDERTV